MDIDIHFPFSHYVQEKVGTNITMVTNTPRTFICKDSNGIEWKFYFEGTEHLVVFTNKIPTYTTQIEYHRTYVEFNEMRILRQRIKDPYWKIWENKVY